MSRSSAVASIAAMSRRVVCVVAALSLAACGGAAARHPRATATATAPPGQTVLGPPAATWGAAARRARIPILMYHVVSAAPPGAAFPELWVARQRFAEEMAALRRGGYHAVTLAAAVAAWQRGGPLPRRPLVITFDDGYRSDFTHAGPVLRRLGWPGVLNLAWNNLGRGGITVPEVRRLIAWGWEVDSHTLTHPDLTTLAPAALRHELVGSRAAIERRFGQPARFFCYPYGRYDPAVVAAVRAAGYEAATTEDEGLGRPGERFTLRRIRVSGSDTAATLLARLRTIAA
jgi:peptidoglycan/xylan/chitin deacetylase (PgdA/CDA1 family)